MPAAPRSLVELWLPPALEAAGAPAAETAEPDVEGAGVPPGAPPGGGPVEFDRVVPLSGNLQVAGKQFWLGPARAGTVIRFWADCDLVHLSAGGTRIKTLRSHLSPADLARLAARGEPGQPRPAPPARRGDPRRATRRHPHRARHPDVLRPGNTSPAAHPAQPAHPGPSRPAARRPPAGPPPHPSADPVRVQRRASVTGVIMVAGQKIALGRTHAGQTVTVLASDTTLTIETGDGETQVIGRTTTQPVRSIKAHRPRKAAHVS
ncbi:MAG TPA: hypothetical protein VF223_11730 [Trebonia sp.]